MVRKQRTLCVEPLSKINIMNKGEGFTYALFARSEEKGRDLLEAAVYAVFILSVLLAIGQFATEAKPLPSNQEMSIHHRVHKHHLAQKTGPA